MDIATNKTKFIMNLKNELRIVQAANTAARVPGLKNLFSLFYRPYQRLMNNRRRKYFLKNGLALLNQFHRCCEENNIEYTLAFGTLLGAVREKGFIRHDLDIDVWVWHENRPKDMEGIMSKYGFKLDHSFMVDNGNSGCEETYIYKGVTIDVFYIYDAIDSLPYCCDFHPAEGLATWEKSMDKLGYVGARRIELPFNKERTMTDFYTLSFYIPNNYHDILSLRYGSDYMIPNPGWSNGANPNIIEWSGKKAIFRFF